MNAMEVREYDDLVRRAKEAGWPIPCLSKLSPDTWKIVLEGMLALKDWRAAQDALAAKANGNGHG
jgi:hypothetical protein